jgi:hypothetical protein
MKITKRQLRRIIQEQIAAPLEVTDNSHEPEELSRAWPNVTYKGQDVMELMYNDPMVDRAQNAILDITGDGTDLQEAYLGYSPSKDVFVMGFDVWEAGTMVGGIVEINQNTVINAEILNRALYGGGRLNPEVKENYPDIIGLRYD